MKLKYFYISNLSDEEYNYWFSLMNSKKQKKVLNYINENDRKRTVVGEMLARKLIAEHFNVQPKEIDFEICELGKPMVKNFDIEFNISHSKNIVVCCISESRIGIDVEKISKVSLSLIKKVCTEQDLNYIFSEQNDSFISKEINVYETERFFEIWTYKEAYFKCLGTGIRNLKSISINNYFNIRKVYRIDDYIITVVENVN